MTTLRPDWDRWNALDGLDTVEMPYCCGEADCEQQWHRTIYSRETDEIWELDESGNREQVGDWPTATEAQQAWLAYHRYVADSGCDPLHEFTGVARTVKFKQRYTAVFRKSRLGAMLVELRRGGDRVPLGAELPLGVQDYLCVERTGQGRVWQFAATGSRTWAGFLAETGLVERRAMQGRHRESLIATCRFTLDIHRPRPAATVSRELRRAARKAIKAIQDQRTTT